MRTNHDLDELAQVAGYPTLADWEHAQSPTRADVRELREAAIQRVRCLANNAMARLGKRD